MAKLFFLVLTKVGRLLLHIGWRVSGAAALAPRGQELGALLDELLCVFGVGVHEAHLKRAVVAELPERLVEVAPESPGQNQGEGDLKLGI